jgi:benzoyl-CoA 2,3-dioxygenase component A
LNALVKQHLIDPEICIRCHTCEEACPVDAITHDDVNVVVDAAKCNYCMACIAPCPTGSIDNWRVVDDPYSLAEQLRWTELPPQREFAQSPDASGAIEALDDAAAALIAEAHQGGGGAAKAPASAAKASVNLYTSGKPATAIVQGNYRLTAEHADSDVRHIILDLGPQPFPLLEGQSVGVLAPGLDANGRAHRMRLYSVASPRDGERPNTNNLALTVKREERGVCSNYLCNLAKGEKVSLAGPFGATFLMPDDPQASLVMICTGTGSAPFRGFTMRRQRATPDSAGMLLFFGARAPESLPYFGPLAKVPEKLLKKHFAFSRVAGKAKNYVQDRMRVESSALVEALMNDHTHIYVCGLRAMESGVEKAFADIARGAGLEWDGLRAAMRKTGRYHVETY